MMMNIPILGSWVVVGCAACEAVFRPHAMASVLIWVFEFRLDWGSESSREFHMSCLRGLRVTVL
jgi:hypothetical protein